MSETARLTPITVFLPDVLLEKLNERVGSGSRSAYVRRLLEVDLGFLPDENLLRPILEKLMAAGRPDGRGFTLDDFDALMSSLDVLPAVDVHWDDNIDVSDLRRRLGL